MCPEDQETQERVKGDKASSGFNWLHEGEGYTNSLDE